jgi:hypothetical protein
MDGASIERSLLVVVARSDFFSETNHTRRAMRLNEASQTDSIRYDTAWRETEIFSVQQNLN